MVTGLRERRANTMNDKYCINCKHFNVFSKECKSPRNDISLVTGKAISLPANEARVNVNDSRICTARGNFFEPITNTLFKGKEINFYFSKKDFNKSDTGAPLKYLANINGYLYVYTEAYGKGTIVNLPSDVVYLGTGTIYEVNKLKEN